ncbi:B12-binding domain-containing radical SAM protein [Rubripirellula tenax]|uniref:B12-binding domain-containing radical SAM protein n=1 Tax=Rubripirellula tenax TaxID=2528015 RepID=UPI0016463DA7|nr:radical SAM protein [Rubripirellula tenax]
MQLILGKHSYENFSLSLRKDDILANGELLRFFDHVIFHEEEFASELLQLLKRPEQQRAISVDRSTPQPVELFKCSVYSDLLVLPASQYVWSMPLSRNKCYWKKCTFCVQIKKHSADRYFDESSELASALREIQTLYQLGFRYFIFNDEAIQPAKLKRLSDFLIKNEIDIKWTPRIIADAEIKEDLIAKMAESGCFEVLFGLETVASVTANRMKKVSQNSTEEELFQMLKKFSGHGIEIFLNLIYAFPTESDEEFQETFQFYQRVKEAMPETFVRFNKFHLFYGTDIFNAPSEFGVTDVEATDPGNDLKVSLDYEDQFGRKHSTPPSEKYFLESIGMSEFEYASIVESESPFFIAAMFQVNYASFGLIYKEQNKRNLLSNLR